MQSDRALAVLRCLRSGDWLDRERVRALAAILLGVQASLLLFFIVGTHGLIVKLEHPTTTDFVSFYAAGHLADGGTPALAYDRQAHYAAEENATAAGIGYQFFYYPPVFMLVCAAFSRLPYLLAFVLFEAATLVPCLLVARRVLGDGDRGLVLVLLGFPSVFWTLGLGQNAFLTAALFGGGTLLVDRRPVVAGLLFGALCYKPHIALLVPVALAAGGHWRAFAAAAATAALLALASLAAFGWETWHGFLAAAAAMQGTYASGCIDFAGFVSPFGAVRLLGGSAPLAYGVQAVATLAAAALVGVVWRRAVALPIRAATLAAATLTAVPVLLIYDFLIGAMAMAWLVRAGRQTGFLAWEKTALAVLFVVPLFARNLGAGWHLPLAPLAAVTLVALAALCAWREMTRLEKPADQAAW
jgi:Glycosyltransferase family 87